MPDQHPLISVVTPCLNAAAFIRDAVDSVAANGGLNVEHIVVDGGSTDGTREILGEYDHLKVLFETDEGPYDALNKGFRHSTGAILAWLNADDFYLPRALETVSEVFTRFEQIEWLTTTFPAFSNENGQVVGATQVSAYSRDRALHPDASRFSGSLHSALQQESTFWRRSLWDAAGGRLDTRYHYAADFELWLRFWQHSEIHALSAPLGCFRWRGNQRSLEHADAYAKEVDDILLLHGGSYAGLLPTFGRRAALALRGLPQNALRLVPCGIRQPTVSYDRVDERWEIVDRYAIPA